MFICPKCGATAKTRTSTMLSKETRKSYHQCQNMYCGQAFTTLDTIFSYLNNVTPSDNAEPIPPDLLPRSNYGENQLPLAI